MTRFYPLILSLIILLTPHSLSAQGCGNMNLQLKADIMALTMLHDQLDRDYLYVANKEGGLKVDDISDLASPSLVSTMPITSFGPLHVMNLNQNGSYLYLALGNSFTGAHAGGMAIVDVSAASSPALMDYYVAPSSNSGGGIVKAEGNYAYPGAMGSGLVIPDMEVANTMLQFKFTVQH